MIPARWPFLLWTLTSTVAHAQEELHSLYRNAVREVSTTYESCRLAVNQKASTARDQCGVAKASVKTARDRERSLNPFPSELTLWAGYLDDYDRLVEAAWLRVSTQRPGFWSGGGHVVVADMPVRIDDKVYFETREDDLDPHYSVVLDEIVAALQDHPDLKLRVNGHADPTEGPDALTQLLALDRADGVRDLLIARGLDADRVTVQGQGESQPVAPSSGRQGRAGNRRVEFDVVPTEPPTPEPTLSEEQPLPEGPPVPEGD